MHVFRKTVSHAYLNTTSRAISSHLSCFTHTKKAFQTSQSSYVKMSSIPTPRSETRQLLGYLVTATPPATPPQAATPLAFPPAPLAATSADTEHLGHVFQWLAFKSHQHQSILFFFFFFSILNLVRRPDVGVRKACQLQLVWEHTDDRPHHFPEDC